MRFQAPSMGKMTEAFTRTVPGVIRPLRVLWNEVIGFIFIVLAIWATPAAFRQLREFDGKSESLFRTGMTIIFAGLMAYFGVSSFLKARKISRS
jgi:hypothetical protein